ncbi:Hypothetical protein NTJ_04598 [Nesidiocoris tenuis]|uniref:MD-2-related lipid-recognition domain-containing protein n=1 Tax=Nesidiocoris tenuis TaxID=355587 RepID=A0ABN7AHQ4_9HEMI|nr:Hypothetical protein NTJ_04598 [Nesidiocoris tenuis]
MFYILVCLALIGPLNAVNRFAGPFNLVAREPFECEDSGTNQICLNETSIRKTGKKSFRLSGRITLDIPISDDLEVVLSFSVWGNGGWKPNFLTLQGKACTMFKEKLPGAFAVAMSSRNMTAECPIPPGSHLLEDADSKPVTNVEALPYNKYKVYIRFYDATGILVGCFGFVIDVTPIVRRGYYDVS